MSPKERVEHGNRFPFDAPDAWWAGDVASAPAARDKFHAAARGVIADLQDRRGIKHGFADIEENTRAEIVATIASIIEEGTKVIEQFIASLPVHRAELTLAHNPHTSCYETVECWEDTNNATDDWISQEEREAAIKAKDFWELDWYPDTPVGHYRLCAHDLAKLIEAARAIREEESR